MDMSRDNLETLMKLGVVRSKECPWFVRDMGRLCP